MDQALPGGGEMGALMRTFDWSKTPLGPLDQWPQSLLTAVRIILGSRYAMFVWWGRELVNLYNDPYRAFLGAKHPAALGRSAREAWSEIWGEVGPRADAVLLRGESTFDEGLLLLMERHGYLEETYFTFSYSPLPDDDGNIGGLFCAVTEVTQQVLGERRLRLLREIAAEMADCRTPEQVCRAASHCLVNARRDLPFSVIYLADADGTLRRAACAGIDDDHPAARPCIRLDDGDDAALPFRSVMETGEPVLVENLRERFAGLPTGEWSQPPDAAVLLPLAEQGQDRPAGVFLAGLNPHRSFGVEFRGFVSLLANQIAAAMANAVAYEAERKRFEQLAELDRAKTAFFSNVSHEFRTPLTLMLGPLEEALGSDELSAGERERLELAHRNSLRLLKLVNALLDFSRLEAGRIQASYQPTDLALLTTELASVFRSAIERAGLRLVVDCESISAPVYVDREMWEKVVLNLLSNAFKFTLDGEITITLRQVDGAVEMTVRDTGTGIPPEELPHVFERFHRVKGARGRSYEGSGIGLALVQELVRLHGGSVRVSSVPDRGTTFAVTLPLGKEHLPSGRIEAGRDAVSTSVAAAAYVDEAERWVPADLAPPREQGTGELIVVADDNADMREYIANLLRAEFRVHAVSDGGLAVAAARDLRPALVLTDVMMPSLDGFGVLRAIRDDAELRGTPVILLSARAGEEARVEGLDAGADDYLVKPFTARELVARVSTHVRMSKLRREASGREAALRAEAELERHRMEELLAQAPAAIALLAGPEHRFAYVNQRYLAVTGRGSAADFIGKSLEEALPELQMQTYRALLDEVYRTGKPYIGDEMKATLNRGPNGAPEEAYFDFVYQPVRNAAGAVTGILIHAVDVTDRIQSRGASQHLAAIVQSSDDAIISKDLNGIVTSWNPAAERIFGYTAAEMIGRPILTVIPPELHSDEDRILATIARGERIEHFETERLTKSGERIEVSLTISPIKDQHGRIVGAAKIARDITQRRKAERALQTSDRLASVGRLAATVAHEINNPLEAVTNFIYLAKQRAGRPDVHEFLVGAEEELGRISHLTKQTLGFYRETHGTSKVHVGVLVNSLLAVFMSRIRNKAIEVFPEIKVDPEIVAVSGEVRQLIANLLSNAIDAVDEDGRIRIRLSAATGSQGRPGVRLTVADTGSGIAPEARAHLFEPFFTTKREVGTGLGLWVCRNIVEKHEGSIRVKSSTAPGNSGTVFSIFLPARARVPEILRQAV